MAPTADRPSDQTQAQTPDPQQTDLSRALGAAAEAGKQAYDSSDPDEQGDIAADDAGGTRLAQEVEREEAMPKGPPGAA